jgi:hypothetical protein
MKNVMSELPAKFRAMSRIRRGLVLMVAGAVGLLFVARLHRPIFEGGLHGTSRPAPEAHQTEIATGTPGMEEKAFEEIDTFKNLPEAMTRQVESRTPPAKPMTKDVPYGTPLIAHTAQLAVATKEFARSRLSLEEILERHRGYAARLRMVGRRSGSILSATLRIPSPELGATVSELKSLGEVEQEEQAADEISQQRADLDARLSSAQSTLRRLQELLKKQTYPDGNVRELQRQIASANAEVNRLEAERLASEHRVVFANVQFSLREEIPTPVESLGAQFHSAATVGFNEATASVSAMLLFVIGRGPVVLFWMAILFLPVRFIWRRWLATAVPETAPAARV